MTARLPNNGVRWVCEKCSVSFAREKGGARPIRFCTQRCYHAWRAANGVTTGQFHAGMTVWNKGMKGLQLSPATQYKKGRRSENWLPVGSETVRPDKNGKDRCFVKVAEPNVWVMRAVRNWEAVNGPVPPGKILHHKDRNSLNDDPSNLEPLTRAEHLEEHRREFTTATNARVA